ncbi:PREDICTED: linker for activation of T-cells family member 2 [Acanthisitta chloris]|uniref:linker for activation of T-cells family member 2 n=1 Tax=Acanthisitta chloris TaxID=57068 RepID=UPI0004F0DB87|nr:PREDICTED: linker for activation of T-cells family member 2 [Acanthisitta chloris]
MVQLELLCAAAALMLLGAAVSLCIRCQQSATKRETQLREPRSQFESHQSFEVIRSYSGMEAEPRYQNFLTEECLQGDSAYVEPISLDYYNCAGFFSPPKEKEEDSYSYENVIIGVSHGSGPDESVDYENSAALHTWKKLQQAEVALVQAQL